MPNIPIDRKGQIWTCRIGPITSGDLPSGSDSPMRNAVESAFYDLMGYYPKACFSGWGSNFTKQEMEIVENNPVTPVAMDTLILCETTDVEIWAETFCKCFPNCDIDQGTMIGWFTNAMMAKADEIDRSKSTLVRAFIDKHEISCAESIYQRDVVAEHALELIEELTNEAGYWVDPEGED